MADFFKLRQLQSQGARDLVSTLRSIEINALDSCNRSCSFCPQSTKEFKKSPGRISLDLIQKIANDLKDIDFDGRVTFTGFGEPLLYKELCEAVKIIRKTVTDITWIEIVTNGDYLDKKLALRLNDSGCTNVTVSMYDRDITNEIIPMFSDTRIDLTFKHSYAGFDVVNRNEMILKNTNRNKRDPCWLPFYKMIIDIDGSVILCSNDWARTVDLGNVKQSTILDLWLGDRYSNYRKNLLKGHRKNCDPCRYCDIQGTLNGEHSVTIWKHHL